MALFDFRRGSCKSKYYFFCILISIASALVGVKMIWSLMRNSSRHRTAQIFILYVVFVVRSSSAGPVVHTCTKVNINTATFGDRLSVRSCVEHCALKRSFVIEISFGRDWNRLTHSLAQTTIHKNPKFSSKLILYFNWVGTTIVELVDCWRLISSLLEQVINKCGARSEPKTI